MPQFGGAVGEELFQRRVALHGAGYGIHECHSDRRAFKHRPELRFAPSQHDLRLFAVGDICQHPEHARDVTRAVVDREKFLALGGYDPVFFYEPFGKTFGEVDGLEKDRVSHRGKSFARLREFLGILPAPL